MTEEGHHLIKFTLEELRHMNANMAEWSNPNCDICKSVKEKIVKAILEATE